MTKKKTKEEYEQEAIETFEALGKTEFTVRLTPQARKIISAMGEAFPMEHFKQWWLENYARVDGGQLHHYLSTAFSSK